MWYLVYIVAAYVGFFVGLYGFIWCTRKVSKWLRGRKDYTYQRYIQKRARAMTTGPDGERYNKQALGRIIRTVTKKSKYN